MHPLASRLDHDGVVNKHVKSSTDPAKLSGLQARSDQMRSDRGTCTSIVLHVFQPHQVLIMIYGFILAESETSYAASLPTVAAHRQVAGRSLGGTCMGVVCFRVRWALEDIYRLS